MSPDGPSPPPSPSPPSPSPASLALRTSPDDRGHRLGNFRNYYAFHPARHRLDALGECGALSFLAGRIAESAPAGFAVLPSADDGGGGGSVTPTPTTTPVWTYCDLGCNEGDLALALARELASAGVAPDSAAVGAAGTDADGGGGRRVRSCRRVRVRALGLDIDPALIERAEGKKKRRGPRPEWSDGGGGAHRGGADGGGWEVEVEAEFRVCDLCDSRRHGEACDSFLLGGLDGSVSGDDDDDDADADAVGGKTDRKRVDGRRTSRRRRFDLTTIFSATMWIHAHAGDNGLRDFLRRACDRTEVLLVEPQPSRCYRSANARLRKMRRPEIELITSRSLSMRAGIEDEIEGVVLGRGFRRVHLGDGDGDRDGGAEGDRDGSRDVGGGDNDVEGGGGGVGTWTAWGRDLRLYERA